MTYNVLIYGANGHSGRMITESAIAARLEGVRLILAGRSGKRLADLVDDLAHGSCLRDLHLDHRPHEVERRAFELGDRAEVIRQLVGIDLVVNTAGPFALTAQRLAKCCLEVGSSYVDINGEIDVYMKLDDLARQAGAQRVALVSSAGHTAGASCLMLDYALEELRRRGVTEIGAIRIAMSSTRELSGGSVATGLRLMREQVLTVRRGEALRQSGASRDALVKWHEPAGRLERTFDFGDLERRERRERGVRRVASAANMVDTLVALTRVERGRPRWSDSLTSIESYLEMDFATRTAYQVGSAFSSLMASPLIAFEARMLASLISTDRPSARPGKQAVVLEIDDPFHQRIMDLRLTVKSGYAFTAQLVVELIRAFADRKWSPGWKTPAEILRPGPKTSISRVDIEAYGDLFETELV
jgi:short subunit dehydrogenase-like uncharacterized protein